MKPTNKGDLLLIITDEQISSDAFKDIESDLTEYGIGKLVIFNLPKDVGVYLGSESIEKLLELRRQINELLKGRGE